MTSQEIIQQLKSQANAKNVEAMARFGIHGKNVLSVSIPVLRKMAKDIKKGNSNDDKTVYSERSR